MLKIIIQAIACIGLLQVAMLNDAHGQIEIRKKDSIRYLALGDSYTIGERVSEDERWPMQLADRLRQLGCRVAKPVIIAKTGWRTDQLRDALVNSEQPHDFGLVSLLIGVNNQYQKRSVEDYAPEFEQLLRMAIERAGGRKDRVFVVSIPDYGFTPFGQQKQARISEELDLFNARNKSITESMGIAYFHITDISRRGLADPELVASDQLHPSGKMYGAWVDRILRGFLIR